MESIAIEDNDKIIEFLQKINSKLEILQKPITQMQQKDDVVCSAMSLNNLADMSRLTTEEKLSDCIPLFEESGTLNKVNKSLLQDSAEKINPHFVKNVQSVSFNQLFFSKNNSLFKSNSGNQINSKKNIDSRYNILFVFDASGGVFGRFKLSNASIARKREGYLQEIAKMKDTVPESLLQSIISDNKEIDEKRLSQYIVGNDSILNSTKELSEYDLKLSNKEKKMIVPSNYVFSKSYKNLSDFQDGIFIFTSLIQAHAKLETKISFEEFLKQNDIEIKPISDLINTKFEKDKINPSDKNIQKKCFKKSKIDIETVESCFEIFLKMLPPKELIEYISINEEAFKWLLSQEPKLSGTFSSVVNEHINNSKLKSDEIDKLKAMVKSLDCQKQNKPKP